MDDSFTYQCPHCGDRAKVPGKYEGVRILCGKCKQGFVATASPAEQPQTPDDLRAETGPPKRLRRSPDWMICPNDRCGYEGAPTVTSRTSWLLFAVLLALGGGPAFIVLMAAAFTERAAEVVVALLILCLSLIPGLLYRGLRDGSIRYCPRCGLQIRSDA